MGKLGLPFKWTLEICHLQELGPWEVPVTHPLCPSLLTTCFQIPQVSAMCPSPPFSHRSPYGFCELSLPIPLAPPTCSRFGPRPPLGFHTLRDPPQPPAPRTRTGDQTLGDVAGRTLPCTEDATNVWMSGNLRARCQSLPCDSRGVLPQFSWPGHISL